MARFNVIAPDGSIIEVDAPEGATEQDAIAFAASIYKPVQSTAIQEFRVPTLEGRDVGITVQFPTEAAPAPAQAQSGVSTMERMFGLGSPIARTVKGAVVDPIMAGTQLIAGTEMPGLLGTAIRSAPLFGLNLQQDVTQSVRDYETATREARKDAGSEGFDFAQLTGNLISPLNRIIGGAQALQSPGVIAGVTRSGATGGLLAAFAPVDAPADDFSQKKLEQVTLGAVLGPVLEGGVKAVGAFKRLFDGYTAKGRENLMREQLQTLAGPDLPRVINQLRNVKELVTGSRPTAADAISDIPSAVELAALQRRLASQSGTAGKFADRTIENQAARVRAIDDIAGTEAQRLALIAERSAVTGPLRETAQDMSDVAGVTLGNIDRQANENVGRLIQEFRAKLSLLQQTSGAFRTTTSEMLAASKDTANAFKRAQIESLKQNGVYPLLAADITSQLDKAIKNTVSDQSRAVLQGMRNLILSKADENGIIGSRDLYENVRKISNQDIAKLLGLSDKFGSGGIPQQAARALDNGKKLIDASLNKSSDGLWTKYLNSYTDYSARLNRMEVGAFLAKKLTKPLDEEGAGAFATAVENAAATIKRSTGIPRFNKLSDVLTPEEVAAVNSVVADLSRSSKADELSRMMSGPEFGLPNVVGETPRVLNAKVTIFKALVSKLQKGNAQAFDKQMAELLLDPPALAQFLSYAIPKSKINDLTSAMMKLMSNPTRAAFTQVFVIPAASGLVAEPQEQQ